MYHKPKQLSEEELKALKEAQARHDALRAESLKLQQTYYYANNGKWQLDELQDCSVMIELHVPRVPGYSRDSYVVKFNNEVKKYCHNLKEAKLYAETYDVRACSSKLDNSIFSDVKPIVEESEEAAAL